MRTKPVLFVAWCVAFLIGCEERKRAGVEFRCSEIGKQPAIILKVSHILPHKESQTNISLVPAGKTIRPVSRVATVEAPESYSVTFKPVRGGEAFTLYGRTVYERFKGKEGKTVAASYQVLVKIVYKVGIDGKKKVVSGPTPAGIRFFNAE
jgi:hypothetical protein